MSLLSRSLTTATSIATREFSVSTSMRAQIKNLTIIGSGIMGAGIAQVSAQAKINVTLVDQSDEILKKGHASIEKNLRKIAKKKFAEDKQAQESMVSDVFKHITTTTNIAEAVKGADLVIEAIVENLEIKQKLFEQIESAAPRFIVSAQAKINVTLVDQSDEILKKGHASIEKNLRKIAKKKFAEDKQAQESMVSDVFKHITTTTNIAEAVKGADLVIEAIVENLEIKQKLFEQIESAAPSHTILTTNTSSLRLSDVASNLKRKENFGGLHFFNPVPMMKLLEVIPLIILHFCRSLFTRDTTGSEANRNGSYRISSDSK
uniref:3HCDH_N domain-containing protein n=1 Tax=Ascaris lumbricoides TaxID=6252 RepID=A0A0M3IHH1_ASCLU